MAKKKKKEKKAINLLHWKFLLIFGIVLTISFAGGGIGIYHYSHNVYDSSLHGEEALEQKQDTIPTDVLARLQEQEKVLGLNSNQVQKKLPTDLQVPILMYHYVEYVQDKGDKTRISLNTTPYTLEEEIKTLSDAGYTFMTNKELADVFDGKTKLPKKPILLTFDDGYRDFYTDAYPILKKYHAKATQYVIAGFLDRPNHLLTTQLEEIAQDGLVEIGAHTAHHIWLKGQPLDIATYEIGQSKKILEALIHKPVVSFAYPFGAFDTQAIDEVKKSGFLTATSTIPGIDQTQANKDFLFRLRPGGRVGQDLLYCLDHVKECYNLKS